MMAANLDQVQPQDRQGRCAICGTYVLLSDRSMCPDDPDDCLCEDWTCGCCAGQLVLFEPIGVRYGKSLAADVIARHCEAIGGAA